MRKKFKVEDSQFKTSSWTGGVISRCVKVAITGDGVGMRDSKDPSKTTLYFTHDEWQAFLNGVHAKEFELPKRT